MKTWSAVVLFVAAMATGCKKEKIEVLPEPTAEMSRTLTSPEQNNRVKAQTYTSANLLNASAETAGGKLQLLLTNPPLVDGSSGESIWVALDAPLVSPALIGQYQFDATSRGILNARYVYQVRNTSGDIWGSITERKLGTQFGGTVSITAYNAWHRTISGTCRIEVQGLIHDPTEKSPTSQVDPANRCNLVVEGTFENIRVH